MIEPDVLWFNACAGMATGGLVHLGALADGFDRPHL